MQEFIEDLVHPLIRKSNSKEMQFVHEKKIEHTIGRQVIFCSATITKQIENLVSKFWIPGDKNFTHLVEKNTHMNLANLDHEFIKLSERDKYESLRLLLEEFKAFKRETNTSAMVFCNSVNSARSAEHTIRSFGYKVSSLHGDIPPRMRNKYFQDFKNRNTEVLIATDLGSRGLDFPFVSHIFNLDFPRTISDYIHRAGRAGRAGRVGYVKSFYRNYDERIIEEMRRSHEESIPMKIGSSAFNLRKTHERPLGGSKIRPLPVSQPGKRKSKRDPLAVDSSLLIKSYTQRQKFDPQRKRVANFQNKRKNANQPKRLSTVKANRANKRLERKLNIYTKKKERNYIPYRK